MKYILCGIFLLLLVGMKLENPMDPFIYCLAVASVIAGLLKRE